jgi:hypothetical protein
VNINTDDPNDDPTEAEQAAQELALYVNHLAQKFWELRTARHEAGAQEYGALTFLGNDVLRMMLEELADTANYCEMQAVKLMMLQEQLEQLMTDKGIITEDKDEEPALGFKAFKGTKDVGWDR